MLEPSFMRASKKLHGGDISSALKTAASEWGGLWETGSSRAVTYCSALPSSFSGRLLGHVLVYVPLLYVPHPCVGWEFIPVTHTPFTTQEPGQQTSTPHLVSSRAHFKPLWCCNTDHSTTKISMLMTWWWRSAWNRRQGWRCTTTQPQSRLLKVMWVTVPLVAFVHVLRFHKKT